MVAKFWFVSLIVCGYSIIIKNWLLKSATYRISYFFQSHCKCGKMTLETNFCHWNHTRCINWKYEFLSFIESLWFAWWYTNELDSRKKSNRRFKIFSNPEETSFSIFLEWTFWGSWHNLWPEWDYERNLQG